MRPAFRWIGARASRVPCANTQVDGDGRQPVFALLNRSTLPALTAYLQQGRRKADGWYAGLSVTEVEFADGTAFCNINYSDDLADLNAGTGPF